MMTSEQLKIYEWLENHKYLSSRQLSVLMGYKDTARVRNQVDDLREAFYEERVEKLVCYKKNIGYFLSDNLEDAIYLIERNEKQGKTMLYKAANLRKRLQVKDNIKGV